MPQEPQHCAPLHLSSVPNVNSDLSQFAAAVLPAVGIFALNQLA